MRTALLVIDVQQALSSGRWAAFDIDRVVDRINQASAKARMAGVPVFFVQHEEADSPMTFDSAGWQLYERLDVRPEDVRVRKTTPDSFHGTDLHALLQGHDVGRLVVCGMQSECCIDSTVRAAAAHGYGVVLLSDAHTTMDNAVLTAAQIVAHHNATLVTIGGYGVAITAIPAAELTL